jgi:hypothetical protein
MKQKGSWVGKVAAVSVSLILLIGFIAYRVLGGGTEPAVPASNTQVGADAGAANAQTGNAQAGEDVAPPVNPRKETDYFPGSKSLVITPTRPSDR